MDHGMRTFSLASLAVSVSAAALMGVSNVAEADSLSACLQNYPCDALVYFPHEGAAWFVSGFCGYGFYGDCACYIPPTEGVPEGIVINGAYDCYAY